MARRSSFSDEAVFAHVAAELVEHGALRVQELTRRTGVSVGSLYHRFGSREGLMAQAWLWAVERFQRRFLAALEDADLESGVAAALATPRFCREQPDAATILACCRRSEFLGSGAPTELAARIAAVNDQPAAAVRAFSQRTGRSLLACRLALIAYPLAAVRLFLPGDPVPEALDAEIAKAYHAALEQP